MVRSWLQANKNLCPGCIVKTYGSAYSFGTFTTNTTYSAANSWMSGGNLWGLVIVVMLLLVQSF